jgi:hypothetical protein
MAENPVIIVNGRRVKGLMLEGFDSFYVQCDVVKQEEYTFESEATNYPIEDSADGSDHILLKPQQVTFEGIVSATPMVSQGSNNTSEIDVRGKNKTEKVKVIWSRPPGAIDTSTKAAPTQAAFYRLEALVKGKYLLTVVLGLKVYYNMALIRVHVTKRAGDGSALKFNATLREIIKSNVQIVQYYGPYLQNRAAPPLNRGTVTAVTE